MGVTPVKSFHRIFLSMYLFFKQLYRNIFIRDGFKGEIHASQNPPLLHNQGTSENQSQVVKDDYDYLTPVKISALQCKISQVLSICFELEKQIRHFGRASDDKGDSHVEKTLEDMEKEFYRKLTRLEYTSPTIFEKLELGQMPMKEDYDENNPNDVLCEEIRSLRVVLDLRNEEIRKLHDDILCYREVQEEMVLKKEQIKRLVARVEDVEAQLSKSRQDKTELKLELLNSGSDITKLRSENTHLAKRNEQLSWKIHTSKTESPDIG